jgi:hypothetical protein
MPRTAPSRCVRRLPLAPTTHCAAGARPQHAHRLPPVWLDAAGAPSVVAAASVTRTMGHITATPTLQSTAGGEVQGGPRWGVAAAPLVWCARVPMQPGDVLPSCRLRAHMCRITAGPSRDDGSNGCKDMCGMHSPHAWQGAAARRRACCAGGGGGPADAGGCSCSEQGAPGPHAGRSRHDAARAPPWYAQQRVVLYCAKARRKSQCKAPSIAPCCCCCCCCCCTVCWFVCLRLLLL